MNTPKGGAYIKELKSLDNYRVVRFDSKTNLLSLDRKFIDGANCLAYNLYEFNFVQLFNFFAVSVDIPVIFPHSTEKSFSCLF